MTIHHLLLIIVYMYSFGHLVFLGREPKFKSSVVFIRVRHHFFSSIFCIQICVNSLYLFMANKNEINK